MGQPAAGVGTVRTMAWVLAAVAAFALNGLPILGSLLPVDRGLKDFFQEWASARNWWQGRELYMPQRLTVREYLKRELAPGEVEVNAHPPPAVLLALPLGRLEYTTALQVWNLLGLCLIAGSAWLIAKELSLELRLASVAPLVVLFCSNPVRAQFDQGQLNAVLLALLTAAWYWDRRGWGWASGAAVGAAAAIKLFPAYLLLYFACRRNWRGVLGLLAGCAALTGLGWVIFGTQAYVTYFTRVLPDVERWRLSGLNASWHGFWLRLFALEGSRFVPLVSSPGTANLLAALGCVVVSAAAARAAWRADMQHQQSRAWGTCMAAMLLCSPITWDHYFVLLLLPWTEAWLASRTCWRQRWAFGLASAALWLNPVLIWSLWYGREQMAQATVRPLESLLFFSFGFYALLVVWGILAWPGVARSNGQAPDTCPVPRRWYATPSPMS